ncbi:MAG: HD domain-containing protein [Deltaproteobacteria bacterium]|nr:HD domain-containing protein [Deltaproteobacteria bacterium]
MMEEMITPQSRTEIRKMLYAFSSLNDLGQVITSNGSFDDVTRSGLYLILGTLSAVRGAVFRYSTEEGGLRLLAAKGVEESVFPLLPLSKEEERSFLTVPHVVMLNPPPVELNGFFVRHGERCLELQAALLVPLRVGEELVGILTLGERFGGGEYTGEDLQVLAMMAQQLSVTLHNQRLFSLLQKKAEENRVLYENLRKIYHDTIRAFAAAIDAKDEYTRGHSARVAAYAVALGEELGLPPKVIEGLRLAGLLHDIGKITVDSSIIRKKTCLSAEEMVEMHRHPAVGYEILSKIQFPWGDLSSLARHHHEKIDGKGYPDGLRGKDIDLDVRIITLADAFDAMTTDRPYRKQIGLAEALCEVKRCMGSQFDADVARVLFRVLEKELIGSADPPRILPHLTMQYDAAQVCRMIRTFYQ